MRNLLRVDCNHPGWNYEVHTRGNPGICRLCGYNGRKFILRCYQCHQTQCLPCTGALAEVLPAHNAGLAQCSSQKRKISIVSCSSCLSASPSNTTQMDPMVDADEPVVKEPQKRGLAQISSQKRKISIVSCSSFLSASPSNTTQMNPMVDADESVAEEPQRRCLVSLAIEEMI